MKILLGVTSGISIYKIPELVRMLLKDGNEVKVIMTENAVKMFNPIIFKVVSRNEVYFKDFSIEYPLAHIELSDWADEFVIAPLTANTLSKLVNGIADNLLTSTFLAFNKRKILFPSMNVKMYDSQVTQRNIKKAIEEGWEVILPDYGELACGYEGRGRLPSIEKMFGIITRDVNLPLKGKSFIVTAGPTVERIDPVRYISNFSSGKMGIEIAKVLYREGADVLLICGRVFENVPPYLNAVFVESTSEMFEAIKVNIENYDGLYMAAAPVDFRPEKTFASKIKKQEVLTLNFVKTIDILEGITSQFRDKLYVGFALESDDSFRNAKEKLMKKSLDFIALNLISDGFNPMGSNRNTITLIDKNGNMEEIIDQPKDKVALWLVSKTLGLNLV